MNTLTSAKHRFWLLPALLGLVTLFVICQALSIDWDMGQRGRQKIAYLEMRRLSGALEIVRTRKGAYPAHIESLRDSFIEVVISEDNYHDRGSAELSWNRVVDKNSPWGYVYDYEPSESKSDALLFAHYKLHADPKERGKSGFRSFYVDDTGPIRWNDKRRATVTDPVPDVDPVLDLHSFWREHLRHWSSRSLVCLPIDGVFCDPH